LGGTGSTLSQFDYRYNPASQRTSVTNLDGSYWVYGYDSMGQVTSGKKYWSDGTPVAGQQFDYAFDDIGNRQTTTRDGRQATYSPNNLNQYTSRTVPGFVNVLGTATNTATVSLWSQDNLALYTPTTRKGDYFRGEMLFNNNTGALWLTITNVAVLSNDTGADIVTNIAGNLLLAKNPEAFTYDADGNLTSDGLWTNVWNGENRRITIESRSTLPSAAKVKEAWTLLADGRWIERIVSTNNGTAYYPSLTNRYVWDNQVLLAVLDHTNGVVVSFMRGIDMSDSLQGAGGVGGVLAVKAGTSAQCGNMANTTHFTCYDGNGNVTALINAATGEESARYEYDPFAEPLRITGPMAKLNPIRFSTQYHDDYTGDDKYLFRDLRDGRWPNRDPIEEAGGLNFYSFARNAPVQHIDAYGLWIPGPDGRPQPPNLPKLPPGPSCSSLALELFADYAGFGNFTHMDKDAMIDVVNSQEVQGFMASLLAEAKGKWACGKNGRLFRGNTDHAVEFNPASMDMPFARRLDWAATGNWQLFMLGECKWKCKPCRSCCGCVCSSSCTVKGTISKYYTFVYVPGGNPKNLVTTVLFYPFNYGGDTFIIDEPFSLTGGDIGIQTCN
jgi:RHS repeat-associated protein